jgi:hypothetical protein
MSAPALAICGGGVGDGGIADQGQMSKLLMRLENLGLIENTGNGAARGEPNAWGLTGMAEKVPQAIQIQTGRS